MYIIYWTVYYGQKMPRNYIGSTTLEKHQNGYLGSVVSAKWKSIWLSEIKNNRHLFKSHIIEYVGEDHGNALEREEFWQRKYNVITNPLFINLSYTKNTFRSIGPCSLQRKNNISLARQKTNKIQCQHCNKLVDPGNYQLWHGDVCRHNPNLDPKILIDRSNKKKHAAKVSIEKGTQKPFSSKLFTITVTCPHCGTQGTNYGNMRRHHFDKCKYLTITCNQVSSEHLPPT